MISVTVEHREHWYITKNIAIEGYISKNANWNLFRCFYANSFKVAAFMSSIKCCYSLPTLFLMRFYSIFVVHIICHFIARLLNSVIIRRLSQFLLSIRNFMNTRSKPIQIPSKTVFNQILPMQYSTPISIAHIKLPDSILTFGWKLCK